MQLWPLNSFMITFLSKWMTEIKSPQMTSYYSRATGVSKVRLLVTTAFYANNVVTITPIDFLTSKHHCLGSAVGPDCEPNH